MGEPNREEVRYRTSKGAPFFEGPLPTAVSPHPWSSFQLKKVLKEQVDRLDAARIVRGKTVGDLPRAVSLFSCRRAP